jgi:uncharacterized protein (TIGR02145 family)
MKTIALFLTAMAFLAVGVHSQDTIPQNTSGLIDSRDSHSYRTVQIGTQLWMAENLAYMPKISPSKVQGGIWVFDFQGTSVPEAKATENYQKYGCLYDWLTATANNHGNGKDICPKGWHIPTDLEWKELEMFLGMTKAEADTTATRNSGNAGKKLKASEGWDDNGNGDNRSGFTALPGGCRNPAGYFLYKGKATAMWTSTEANAENAWNRIILFNSLGIDRLIWSKLNGRSVRCIRD